MTDDGLTLLPERLGLPRGRSALPESEVAASQQGRILQAVIDEVADVGYARATVAGITRRARVSRTTFYQSFSDKEDCFARAHVVLSDQIVTVVRERASRAEDADWEGRILQGVRALADCLEARPAYARAYLVEVHGAGERVLRQRDAVLDRHSRGLVRVAALARAAGVAVREPSALEVIGAVGAAETLVGRAVRHAGPTGPMGLHEMVPAIVSIHVSLLRPHP